MMLQRKLQERQRIIDAGVKDLRRLGQRTGTSLTHLGHNAVGRLRGDLGKDGRERRRHFELPALRSMGQDVPEEVDFAPLPGGTVHHRAKWPL